MEPHMEYDQYTRDKYAQWTYEQKNTPCECCPFCVSDMVSFGVIGELKVGFCLDSHEFLTGEEMDEKTMFDCFQGE